MVQMPNLLLPVGLFVHLGPPLSFADGFLILGPSIATNSRPPLPLSPKSKSTLVLSAVDDKGGTSVNPHPPRPPAYPHPPALPAPPEDDIDTKALLSQVYTSLTAKQLRDLLRQAGAKVSGSKRELVDRLEAILVNTGKDEGSQSATILEKSTQQSPNLSDSRKRNLINSYNRMTLKELKDLLRRYGAKVTGKKRELVHRLMISQYENPADKQTLSQHDDSSSSSTMDNGTGDVMEQWSILDPSISFIHDITTETKRKADEDELPTLSGLLFVNKPSGWSTLPTKQQLDEPSNPTFPCLADSVKKWLYNHPERMKQAQEDEERWWNYKLQSTKQLKKWNRIRDKQNEKMEAFEPRPVHRLDIDTSGIVCIALTPYALRAASMLFELKSTGIFAYDEQEIGNRPGFERDDLPGVQKRYVALAEGALGGEQGPPIAGLIRHPIGKVWIDDHHEWACDISSNTPFIRPNHPREHRLMTSISRPRHSDFVSGSVREAVTSYRAIDWSSIQTEQGDVILNVTRVELTPYTGRGHQLRLHLASLGYPIVGDDMHGVRAYVQRDDDLPSVTAMAVNRGRLCLHASKLSMKVWCAKDVASDEFQMCRVDVETLPPF